MNFCHCQRALLANVHWTLFLSISYFEPISIYKIIFSFSSSSISFSLCFFLLYDLSLGNFSSLIIQNVPHNWMANDKSFAVAIVIASLAGPQWLLTEEKLPNPLYNGTINYNAIDDGMYIIKTTKSSLWILCFAQGKFSACFFLLFFWMILIRFFVSCVHVIKFLNIINCDYPFTDIKYST